MSVYLHGLSMRANLSANLRSVLMALCDAAGEDDGTKCHPSLAYISYKTGFSERHTRRLLRTLEVAGYIEAVAFVGGGRGHSTWYRIHMTRVPLKPSWDEIKKRLIESGELAADDDMPPSASAVKKAVLKRAEALKGDKMSALRENALKGDKMSAFSDERGTKCPPLDPQRGTKCPPSIPSKKEDSYEDEDSYAEVTSSTEKILTPGDRPASQLWAAVVRALGATTPAAAMASWIYPARIAQYGWDADNTLCVELMTPGRAHADILDQRYCYLITDALARIYHLPTARVAVSLTWKSLTHTLTHAEVAP
ncbi:MAG TPA: helix-turn-helix domain-containing protein [Ktedonobacterales bacterium]